MLISNMKPLYNPIHKYCKIKSHEENHKPLMVQRFVTALKRQLYLFVFLNGQKKKEPAAVSWNLAHQDTVQNYLLLKYFLLLLPFCYICHLYLCYSWSVIYYAFCLD